MPTSLTATRCKFMGPELACGELMRRKAVSFVGADDSLQYQCGAKAATEFDALIARRPIADYLKQTTAHRELWRLLRTLFKEIGDTDELIY
jgi:hypothetical protein